MDSQAVAARIRAALPDAEVEVSGDDGAHFEALVVSERFAGLGPLQKQRLVMDSVKAELASGELHALSIRTLTPAERAGS